MPRTVGEGAVAFIIFAGTAQQDNCCQKGEFEVFVSHDVRAGLGAYHLFFYKLQAVFVNSLEAVISSSNLDVCLL